LRGLVVAHDDEGFTRREKVERAEHGLAVVWPLELTDVDHAGGGERLHRYLLSYVPTMTAVPVTAV
jgi:hypothetical protein